VFCNAIVFLRVASVLFTVIGGDMELRNTGQTSCAI